MCTLFANLYVLVTWGPHMVYMGTPYIFDIYMIRCGWLGCLFSELTSSSIRVRHTRDVTAAHDLGLRYQGLECQNLPCNSSRPRFECEMTIPTQCFTPERWMGLREQSTVGCFPELWFLQFFSWPSCLWGCESNLQTILFLQLGPVLLVLIIIILINIELLIVSFNKCIQVQFAKQLAVFRCTTKLLAILSQGTDIIKQT